MLCPESEEEVEHRIILERWSKWKQDFKEAADAGEVGEEYKDVAKCTVDIMELLERGMSF